MVSKVNMASRSVTVEWYERGETKGKEVELDMLLQLNPDIFNITEPEIIQQPPPQPTNLQRVSMRRVFWRFFRIIPKQKAKLNSIYSNF